MPHIPHKIKKLIEHMDITEIKEGHCSGDWVYKVADLVTLG